MWSDNETTIDYLNFGVVADACTKLLMQAKGAPISVGVSGGWGMGKTSLVRMIENRLQQKNSPENSYVIITFNPWLYQDFDSARNALLQLVGDEILKLANKNESLLGKARKLLARINLLRLAQLGGEAAITLHTGVPVGTIGKIVAGIGNFLAGNTEKKDSIELGLFDPAKTTSSMPTEIQFFRSALEEMLEELRITLVVFVDDLDRCLPKTAISTLESIRLLLFLKRSAFVIAADNDFIRTAVQAHFGSEISTDVATNYFDKLIQVPLHVPRLGTNEAKAYLALLLIERAHADQKFADTSFEQAKKRVSERLQQSWTGDAVTAEFLQTVVGSSNESMVELMKLAEGLAPLLAQSKDVNANPRLMKRFLNTVYLRSDLASLQGIPVDIPALAKWHLLERCYGAIASELSSKVTSVSDGRLPALYQAEQALKEGTELHGSFKELHDWLALAPELGEMDLRPILHLSRDTATRDFGSDNLSVEGRKLRDGLAAATSANPHLTELIKSVSTSQAKIALEKAWLLKQTKRNWRNQEDVLMLIEVVSVHPDMADTARGLLRQAPVSKVGPALIPPLQAREWTHPILEIWEKSGSLDANAKKALDQKRRQK